MSILTDQQIKTAVDDIFSRYPGMRMNIPTVISFALQSLNAQPANYSQMSDEVADWLRKEAQPGGTLLILKGQGGGIMKNQAPTKQCATGWNVSTPQPEHSTAAKPTNANDRTCPSCGNPECNSDERSCWKCGASLT